MRQIFLREIAPNKWQLFTAHGVSMSDARYHNSVDDATEFGLRYIQSYHDTELVIQEKYYESSRSTKKW